MLEVIACVVLHCVMAFVLKYCYDEEFIWHKNEEVPNLHMPKLFDLSKECSLYNQQKYVEEVIIPANKYFSEVADIESFQENEIMVQWIAWTPTFLLVANAFRKTQITPYLWLNIVIAITICVLIVFIVSMIYNRTRLKLGTFESSVSDLKKRFYDAREYCIENNIDFVCDISEENALNNHIIEVHHRYIHSVHYTIEKRYRVKKVVESVTGLIYVLFICRIPN